MDPSSEERKEVELETVRIASQDAHGRLAEMVDVAAHNARLYVVTRYGKDRVVMLGVDTFEALTGLRVDRAPATAA